MQWGRGIFRLWIVLSALWLIVAGAFATSDWRDHPMPVPPELCKDIEPNRVAGCEEAQTKGREQVTARRQITVAIVTVPPLAVLLIGIGLWWVVAGFQPPRHPS